MKHDWTLQVREDLEDFCIPVDLEYIKSKSQDAFKRLVKVKAQVYALDKLNKVKAGHSKMDGIFYPRLEMQKYLKTKNISPENAKLIFAYRTRMAGFTENFRGPYGPKLCPLCLTHLDNQQGAFQCPIILPSLGKGKYNELFASEIPMHLLNDLRTIEKIREENQE